MLNKGILEQAGIGYDGLLARCIDDAELLEAVLCAFLEDKTLENMQQAYAQKDYVKMFQCVHAMKGTSANGEMKPLCHHAKLLTELLRNNPAPDLQQVEEQLHLVEKYVTQIRNAIVLAQEAKL